MKQIYTVLILFLVSFFFPGTSANSQVPQGFNYQAVARGASGEVLTGVDLTVRVAIVSDINSSTIYWEEEHSVQTNSYGLFTIVVGNPQAVNIGGTYSNFSDIDWSSSEMFLRPSIKQGASAWQIMPASRIVSVPYAMISKDTEKKQELSLSGDNLELSDGGSISLSKYNSPFLSSSDTIYRLAGSLSLGSESPNGSKLAVVSTDDTSEKPLFEVRRADGQPVFSVFNTGVEMYFDESVTKGPRGGFAIGGFDKTKGVSQDYFRITPDSTRVYIRETTGIKGPSRGGFAIGGFDDTKALSSLYLNVSGKDDVDLFDDVAQILWYPRKEAFLAGRVHIGSADSVGINSTALGYRSIAMGDFTQAFGYQTRALANNSTAIGNRAKASGFDSYAFGSAAEATGDKSFALGSVGIDSLGNSMGEKTLASGSFSMALGMSSQALQSGALAIGVNSKSSGIYSTSIGYRSQSSGSYSNSFGLMANAYGNYSMSIGMYSKAGGLASLSLGYGSRALGDYSMALGFYSQSDGKYSASVGAYAYSMSDYSYALGRSAQARNTYAYAIGYNAITNGSQAFAIGTNAAAGASYAVALGRSAQANGITSTAIGFNSRAQAQDAYSFGTDATASEINAYAIGKGASAGGNTSLSMGYMSNASAQNAVALGNSNVSNGTYSLSLGNSNTAGTGSNAIALGNSNVSSGTNSVALGNNNTSSGSRSLAIGSNSTSTMSYSTAIGYYTSATDNYATALGYYANATGSKSMSLGANYTRTLVLLPIVPIIRLKGTTVDDPKADIDPNSDPGLTLRDSKGFIIINPYMNRNNIAEGDYSIAVGNGNYSTNGGITFGVYNSSSELYGTSIGFQNSASAKYSFAGGYGNQASGEYSTAMGRSTEAQAQNSFAIGRYNAVYGSSTAWVETDPLFQIGNGYGPDAGETHDAMRVLKNGGTYLWGSSAYYGLYVYNNVAADGPYTIGYGIRSIIGTNRASTSYYSGYFSRSGSSGTYYGLYADYRTGYGADVAEYYYSTSTEAGDVVVADPGRSIGVIRSTEPFQTSVLGVISTNPHLTMGIEIVANPETGELKEDVTAAKLALNGRVPCKVTDENGPIEPGDLLTSSSVPGHAMKWSLLDVATAKDFDDLKKMLAENERRRNAIIGKAVEAHRSGNGTIQVLVSLQ